LGILGRLPSSKGADQRKAITDVISMTQLADQLGFSRSWLTEHQTCLLDSSPETLLPLMAATTQRIKVGTAAILLDYYSPYKVAKTFHVLSTLFPSRIDLGVCGGRVGDMGAVEGMPLNVEVGFDQRNLQLQACLRRNHEEFSPLESPQSMPHHWIVGTGYGSMNVAGKVGTSYCYSLCHNQSDADPAILATYRQQIENRENAGQAPLSAVLVAGICAPTSADASAMLADYTNPYVVPTMAGTPGECAEKLHSIADRFGTPHIIWWDLSPTHEQAQRSLTLLSESVGLRR
jgi:luciferase family oxidoreductase group 1